jgi:hypothetical protein
VSLGMNPYFPATSEYNFAKKLDRDCAVFAGGAVETWSHASERLTYRSGRSFVLGEIFIFSIYFNGL